MKTQLILGILISSLSGFGQTIASRQEKTLPVAFAPNTVSKWTLAGEIIDSVSGKPVPYASISVYDSDAVRSLGGTTGNAQGYFSLTVPMANTYSIEASSIGFARTKRIISAQSEESQMSIRIALKALVHSINEVTVRASKPIVEEQLDRIVYHADRDITAQSGMATDLMRKVPLVTVLPDGGLMVRGAANVKILVNGKTSVLSNNPTELLRQLPAESIKTIEVITSPSARYDAEGGTIINIVTKKNLAQGVNATLNGGVGSTGSNAASSLSATYKKWSFSSGLTGNWFYNPFSGITDLYQISNGNRKRLLSQQANGKYDIQVVNANAGLEYRLSDKTRLLIGYNRRIRQVTTDRDAYFDWAGGDVLLAGGHFYSRSQANTDDWNVEYSHSFKRTQQELTVSWTGGITQNQTVMTPAVPAQSDTRSQNNEQVFQADYQHPIKRSWLIETGVKVTLRTIGNNVSDSTGHRTSTLSYQQQIRAGYVSSQWDLPKKWSLRTGLRLEQTINRIDLEASQHQERYLSAFPNVLVQKRLKNARSIKFSYGLRIQRPSAQFLNPAVATLDPVSQYAGSPLLRPEHIHTGEMGYNTHAKGSSFMLSAFARRTQQAISSFNELTNAGVLMTRFVNLSSQTDVGLNLYSSTKLWQHWQTIFSANVYYSSLSGGPALENLTNRGVNYALGTMSTWELPKSWAVQLYGGYNSARVRLQGREGAFTYYQLSIRRSLANQKGSLALGVDNPFSNRATWVSYNESNTFAFRSTSYQYNRGIRLTVIYRIGKASPKQESAKSRERRQSDLKEDQ
ncbi:TonB-dependent receptor domain-containing protein [Spirosoma sp. KNUC1025]|uniref:TonB-dependent receptor domain-containing protein n=1 Tax=Spirosoma sp. KNUC1025 TaxID=2894082 RepID=UPI003870A8A7|nr:TonB-dependent receptor [Spirosoma sp. KNUC1025]